MTEETKQETKTKARPPRTERVVVPLTPNKVKPAEFLRNILAATVPFGVTVEDVQEGKYWNHIAKALHVSDRIEVVAEDGSFFAELYVTSVMLGRATVKLLRTVDLTEEVKQPAQESELEVKYRGQISKHTVQFRGTKEIIKDGFGTQAEAQQWLLNYEIGLIK